MAPPIVPSGSVDPQTQLKTYEAYVKLIADPNGKDESKLQAAQELSENFEIISGSSEYPNFLDIAIKVFLKVLREGEPHFITEYNIHQVRKLILEMIYRIPTDKFLKPYAEQILNVTFKLLETENEENVHVCLRIIIELHKHYRPVYNSEIQHFLLFVRTIYQNLPDHVNKIFEPKVPIRVEKLADLHLETLLNEIYTTTPIQCCKKMPDGTKATIQYNLIPKGVQSLKVLQELPTIVVLMYELYKDKVLQEVNDYIPIIIKTITLQPLKQHRQHPSFNKEVFVDFMGAQIKTLSFLAYIIRVYQEVFGKHSQQMLEGILNMLKLCPPKVTHLRKELLMAARHIWATELRLMFVPYMETLFDEDVLLGQGWTTYESLRPLAYSTLADLVHHVRQQLPMSDLVKAVHIFSKNVHDDTLPTSIQTISCKLLLNLVDCIRLQSEKDPAQAQTGQDLLMRMLEVFVMKFKTIAKLHLPILIAKSKQTEIKAPAAVPNIVAAAAGAVPIKKEDADSLPIATLTISDNIQPKPEEKEPSKCRFGFPPLQPTNYNVSDCCSLVKTLVCGVKAITWRFKTLKLQLFKPKETEVFIRFVKWALQALDVYTLSMKPAATLGMAMANQRPLPQQTVRTKEEKDALEHFSGVFSVMNAQTFKEIFSTTIDFIVERMAANFALQIVGNSFLTHSETSPLFATVLVEYLLGRMEEMGNGNMERSNLYLKLFKLVFGSVSLFVAANEHMLRPHLHQIVNRSMELAMTAKEPYNYFLLLRTLFRSIGGGNHDLLYQEFLPLLPNLLQGLNSLQSGLHKQHMKDLFVELCLTVPVRLSSLLPYLPMLMDPLVSALNGSPTLISQGLRTLELCVDNLQPDYLYDHIQPVRADLMQALWRSLRNPTDQVAHVAFRVLGKFGGGNRKMMIEPQKLDYQSDSSPHPSLIVLFPEYDPISLPMNKVIESALTILKTNGADVQFYKQKSWCIVRDYLLSAMNLDDNEKLLFALLTHADFEKKPSSSGQPHSQIRVECLRRPDPIKFSQSQQYQCPNKIARQTHVNALIGMFFSLLNKELSSEVQPVFEMVVRHCTLVAISHQAGPFSEGLKQCTGMDPLVIVDAIASVMGNEEKELCKPGRTALTLILETAEVIMGSRDAACCLPLMEYVAEKMYSLCYDRAWYTKRGGCVAIMFLYEFMSIRWVYQHLFVFVKAQLFVMMDLTGEVSSGAIDQAKTNLEALIKLCAPLHHSEDQELKLIQKKALDDVTLELTRQVTSSTDFIREQSMHLLRVFAQAQGTSVVEVMEPHKKVLEDMIPPKEHYLRHQAANAQIGIMEGNTFCTTLTPRLFSIDLEKKEHKVFFEEVQHLCEASDSDLLKMPCYKNIGSLLPLRKAAMRALAACYYVPNCSDKIFNTFYRCLEKENKELQEAAFQCMKTFVAGAQIDMNAVHEIMRPLLSTLGNYRNINLSGARRLSYLVQLFPSSFNEMLCEHLKQHLQELLENMMQIQKGISKNGETEQIVATIISIFHQIPAAGPRFIEPLSQLVLQTERNLLVGASSPFRHPLLKFLLRYPQETITLLLSDNNIKDDLWSKYLEYLIKHEEGRPFREVLQSPECVERLIAMALAPKIVTTTLTTDERLELQFQSIRIVSLLVKYDDQWLSSQEQLAQTFNQIWCNDLYQQRHRNIESVEYVHWKEPKLLVKILLNYFSHHPSNIDLLFQLLRAFCDRFLPNFQFLKEFLETIVAQSYTVEWKRMAFFRFVKLFPTAAITQRLKAKILQFIIIPCFANCFEKGEGDKLIGGPPSPNFDSPDNVVSEFINKIIDPENPNGCGDSVRILILQLSCLLVEQCVSHIHDAVNSKPQGLKLRRLMTYAWPCLLSTNCVDPATRYHGHLLLSHIIAKLAIHSEPYPRIVLQVFRSLLKAHALEVRPVVRQALEILTPAMPARMDDGYKMLTHWTKKIIVEEGHSMQQLFHILQLVVRHYAVYYPVRHNLLRHMVTALQRLGFSASSSLEHKKLGCELAEIIIRWEHQRIKDENKMAQESGIDNLKRPAGADGSLEPLRKKGPAVISIKHDPDEMKPLEKTHADILINTLMRLACSVNETSNNPAGMASPGEVLSRRCYNLVRMALKPDVWPEYTIDFRLQWMDKIFSSIDQPNPNLGNICVGLELFTLALTFMKKDQVLAQCKILQKGINACISSNNTRVIRLSHLLLTRLMSYYPTEPSTAIVSSKHAELECIYSSVGRVIFDGLSNYEKNTNASSSCLFGAIMMLKAACSSNPSYVDRLITPFIRVIQRMAREHLQSSSDTPAATSDLLILSLDLVKNRVGVMQTETKKTFIGSILVGLIEKTTDSKVMKSICKMVEEWMKNSKPTGPGAAINTGPSLREKSILLGKLMQFVEKRFPDLNTQFLELVNYVYREEAFKTTELIPKLEPAFLAGLRCNQPQIRAKFFEIFDQSIRRRLHDRLMYIVSSQNWETMGQHYWIKQCIELILVTADESVLMQLSKDTPLLPSVTSVINHADDEKRESFLKSSTAGCPEHKKTVLQSVMVSSESQLYDRAKKAKSLDFLNCVIQLCHTDSALAEKLWLDLFPRLWSLLSDRQRTSLSGEILPFLVSGIHVAQKDMHPSSLSTIFEAISMCNPPLQIKPALMSYLGKSHNLWHLVTLSLEKMMVDQVTTTLQNKARRELLECYDFEPVEASPQHAAVEYLAEMYSQLKEEDMWCALWQKHARYKETSIALAYEQQGYFEQAQGAYELAMGKGRQDFSNSPAPNSLLAEEMLWEKQWIRCSKELNQWDHLLEYSRTKGNINPFLNLESAWRVPDWSVMKEAITQVETACPKELHWKVHLYRGYLTICIPEDQHLPIVARYVELASLLCMKEWRRLPHIVSHIHMPLLQAAQQIMELQEACQIHQGLLHEKNNSLQEMKAIVKTWRNRLPVIADDLSHWSDIFTWRQHHYQFIIKHVDAKHEHGTNSSMFGVHASAQAIIHFGKIARKHNLTGVCLDSLARIYTIPSVPVVDCFHKIRQQVKCHLQMAITSGTKELQEGLEVMESSDISFFSNEMTSEFLALKGMLLSQLGQVDDAKNTFSMAVQRHDTLVKAWALWGDFVESQFTKSSPPDISLGVSAITCFLHACRHQNESKSRKYMAKVLWLLTYDDVKSSLAEAVDKYVVGVPPIQWLPWIPQLLTCLVWNEGRFMLNIISQVGRMFLQAVYLPIRTVYVTLKIEKHLERHKSAEQAAAQGRQLNPGMNPQQLGAADSLKSIKATESMWRCSRIMHILRDAHPTVVLSLEGFADQFVWLREIWYEEVLRQLRQGLAKCYVIAFENRGAVSEATITPHTLHFLMKVVSTFGIGIENIKNPANTGNSANAANSAASESLAKRAEVTIQDPDFKKMKEQFTIDFDFSVPGAMKLQNLIQKLKKWIRILEAKTKLLPKSFLIEEKCRFISSFSLQTVEIELPGEFLLPKHSHYYVKISRFMPRVELVQKHNTAARRLFIRGHNGKIYPYLVVNDSGLSDARREERVLQLLRMLNHYLGKQKETSRRFLHITVPRVVAWSPQMRLIEDNPASVSLLDVYKGACSSLDVEHDAPVSKYYERLAAVQARGLQASHQILKDILKDVQTSMISKNLLKEWALRTYPSPTDFWTFRKMFTLQLSLTCFCEYVLHLTRLNPDMLYIHQDSGLLNVSYFKFDVEDTKGDLNANRPVPFRLTPNIQELLTETGISGPLTASMIATAKCLVHPNFEVMSILRAILRDEMIFMLRKRQEDTHSTPPSDVKGEQIITVVTNAINSINARLNSLSHFEGTESKVSTLVVAAKSPDNLCRMDPAWHPWL